MNWQPIESAPRDGTTFVAARFVDDGHDPDYEVGCYRPLTWDRYEPADGGLFQKFTDTVHEWGGFNNFHRMTHWMPLPPPPQEPKT